MIEREYEVISIEERGKQHIEGTFSDEQSAVNYADVLATTYGCTTQQDREIGLRIIKITVRPVWNLPCK